MSSDSERIESESSSSCAQDMWPISSIEAPFTFHVIVVLAASRTSRRRRRNPAMSQLDDVDRRPVADHERFSFILTPFTVTCSCSTPISV